MRRAAKQDASQQEIVRTLRNAGCDVWHIGQPCDLLVRYWSNKHREFRWTPIEVKTPTKTGKRRKRKDQKEQDDFLSANYVPVVMTPDEALRAVGVI